ncbi:MAG: hypothetical protein D6724_03080 [Armatimonadetes bacterium]|nr:MAG: hypothetical protein D6724_03080 [Armatimonadota bacterium]GIV02161.1 MAG: hypothetical protein KatS3mg015_0991 [Fimbriimonadales bacterium]
MHIRRARAYTIAENLFAIFLVAIAAAVMAASLPIANSSRARADLLNKATGIAEKELELIRHVGYQNLTASKLYDLGLLDSTAPGANGMYPFTNVDTGVFDAPSQVLPNGKGWVGLQTVATDLIEVTVLVTWQERGQQRSVTVSTLVANL